jgi:hypothetical protein
VTSAKSAARVVRLNIKDVDDSAHEAVDVLETATVVGADSRSVGLQTARHRLSPNTFVAIGIGRATY